MSYIGKEPTVGNFQKCDAISVVNGQATYALTVGGSAVFPESSNHVLCSLNGILQAPTDSFTISSSNIVFASNLVTGDVIDFVMILGNVLDLGVPSDNTVSTAKIVDGAITSAKLGSGVGGKILQVVSTAKTDKFSVVSNSFTDITGLSLSITPSSTSSKILILSNFCCSFSTNSRIGYFNLVRDTTNIGQPSVSGSTTASYTYDQDQLHAVAINFLDTPNSTSSLTYKIQTKTNGSNDVTITIGDRNSDDLDVISTITAMEISS